MVSNQNRRPALFLDRDGVINVDHGYVYRSEDFEFIPGIFELCDAAQKNNYRIFVVTNQSGIGRGYYSENDFNSLTQWMLAQFSERNIAISGVYFCPHHPQKASGSYLQECDCRKPKPGMLLQAQQDFSTDMAQSVMIGDKLSDLQAAEAAMVGRRILFRPDSLGDNSAEAMRLEAMRLVEEGLVTQMVSQLSQVTF